MKTILAVFTAALACASSTLAADPPKPLVTLTVKKQTLDSDHDLRGKRGSTEEKTLTLRVEISNVSSTTIEAGQLTGTALVLREGDAREKLILEALGTVPVPALKPNARITLDIGMIRLHEKELRGRKFEESLEEWKVVCTVGQQEIGSAVSSGRYEARAAEITPPPAQKKKKRDPGGKKKPGSLVE